MKAYQLSGDEFIFLRVLFIAVEEDKLDYLKMYLLECAKGQSVRSLLTSLKSKKIIKKEYKIPEEGEKFEVDDVEFDDKFIAKIFKLSNIAGVELMRAYPAYMSANGTLLNLRNIVSKGGYVDEDDFYFAYGKKIKFSPKTHKEVLEALEFGKKADLIKYSIVEFVGTSKWIELRETMDQDRLGKFVTKMDTREIL